LATGYGRRCGANFSARLGQTSWSKALVRHGADAGLALAEVLGMPAEDIRVREGAKENLTGVKARGLASL